MLKLLNVLSLKVCKFKVNPTFSTSNNTNFTRRLVFNDNSHIMSYDEMISAIAHDTLIRNEWTYIKNNYNKSDASAILSNPEYKFYTFSHYGAISYWLNSGLPADEHTTIYEKGIKKYLATLLDQGKLILKEKKTEEKNTAKVVSLSPMQRLQRKISDTVMQDLLDLEDQWMDGEKATIDLYKLFQTYSLSGSATLPVRQVVEGWLLD